MTLVSIRARARDIMRAAGATVAGDEWKYGNDVSADCARVLWRVHGGGSDQPSTLALDALRAAGWTVDDDGTIRGVP